MALTETAEAPRRRGRPPGRAGEGDTRAAAIEAARRLLLEGGDAALSMERVARALTLRTPSLYHHFPGGRDEMVMAGLEEDVQLLERDRAASLGACDDDMPAQRKQRDWQVEPADERGD